MRIHNTDNNQCCGARFTESAFGSRFFSQSGSGSEVFLTKNCYKKICWKKKQKNSSQKMHFTPQWRTLKFQEMPPDLQGEYSALQNMKFINFFLFCGPFCLSVSGSKDPVESGSNLDPDPQHWFQLVMNPKCTVWRLSCLIPAAAAPNHLWRMIPFTTDVLSSSEKRVIWSSQCLTKWSWLVTLAWLQEIAIACTQQHLTSRR